MTTHSASSSSSSGPHQNNRSKLNDWLQPRRLEDKLIWEQSESGPGDRPIWSVVCRLDGSVYGRGRGATVAIAKEKAAGIVYRRLIWEEVERLVRRRLNQSVP